MLNPQSIVHWLRHRDLTYVANRAMTLVKRYGMTPSTAKNRIVDGVKLLARYGCSPTFPTPGRVVDAHPAFCRAVQSMGAELAVHGYDHVDFRSLSPKAARAQFATAVEAFQDVRLEIWGFRCPYLSYDPSLSAFLPSRVFRYSSNRAIWWDVLPPEATDAGNAIFRTLQSFYRAESADRSVVTPRFHNEVVEIPASIPDDLQLHDGLKLGADGLAAAWAEILKQTYRRGELFALLFHPEAFSQCSAAFEAILGAALTLQPRVWIAQLREVGEWWHEKSCFTVVAKKADGGFYLDFHCSARATVLVRGSVPPNSQPWYGAYKCLDDREIFIPGESKPFIGVEGNAPAGSVAFLRDQGYLVDSTPTSHDCSLYLTAQQLRAFSNERGLIDFIEADPSPLVRYWRWPSKARSALCVTGDLDALSLVDYLRRLVPSIRRVHQTRDRLSRECAYMRIVDLLDRETWSSFVQQHPNGSIFHTPEMFDVFRSTRGHVPLLLAALDSIGDVLALLVSVKVQTLPWIFGRVSSRALLYAQPICRSGEQGGDALKAIMEEHDRRMRRSVLFTEVRPLSGDGSGRVALTERGYDHEGYLNFLSDVRLSPEELVRRMNKHGRRDLRAGQRQGLSVEDATCMEGIEALYPILQETFANARVPLADKELFVNACRILSPREMMKVFLIQHEGRPLAGTVLLCHRDTVFFWYAGIRRGSRLHAMEVIVFAMLEWAHFHNYRTFDYGGAGRPDKEYGVRDFKAKFGGELVNYGRYRKVYSPWKLAIAERAYEASRSLWSGSRLSMEKQKRA